MHPKYIGFIVFIYVVMAIMTSVMETGSVTFTDTDQEATVKSVTEFDQISSDQPWGFFKVVAAPVNYFESINQILFLKASFLEGNEYAELFRWVVLTPIIALMFYGIIMVLVGIFSRILT